MVSVRKIDQKHIFLCFGGNSGARIRDSGARKWAQEAVDHESTETRVAQRLELYGTRGSAGLGGRASVEDPAQ